MGTPTPAVPIVRNDDGSLSILVYQGRTLRLHFIHEGLTYPPTGYKARFGLTDKYGNALLADADSDAGSIVFVDASTETNPDTNLPYAGTVIAVTIPDEDMEITKASGYFDCVLEEPGAGTPEVPLGVGDWRLYKRVTP